MNKDRYYEKHKNLQIAQHEMERKFRMHVREQEDMKLIEQATQNFALKGAATAGGGFGNGSPGNSYSPADYMEDDYVE